MGFILDRTSFITCPHVSGIATPDQTDVRVTVGGQPLMTVARMYTIGGCPRNTPCSKAIWTKGAEHVTASGLPVAIHDGDSMCVPPGSLKPVVFQLRVQAK